MQGLIDLHTHTTASDGSMKPAELVRHAKKKGLAAIAVTDHDTVDGVDESLEEGRKSGIEVIAGVEISADNKPEMHILGYFLNEGFAAIKPVLSTLRENRENRNPKIVKKLNDIGLNITMEDVYTEAGGGVIGRPHIAKALIKKGYVGSMEEAFNKYLAEGRSAYAERDKLKPDEAIREIIKAGGIPVLAHPIYLDMGQEGLDKLLSELIPAGLKGIEAYYVDNNDEETSMLVGLAVKHGMIITGGSDFHGNFKPDIEIGTGLGNLRVPYELIERLKAAGSQE